MKSIILALALFSGFASATCEYRKEFNDEQWHNIRAAFIGSWFTDYKYSVAAISIVESSAGLDIINDRTNDYGNYQINWKTAQTRMKWWQESGRDFGQYDLDNLEDVKTILITDESIGRSLAIEELKYWYTVRKGDWHQTWASYNGGYYRDTTRQERAGKYSRKIHTTVIKLKTCKQELIRG